MKTETSTIDARRHAGPLVVVQNNFVVRLTAPAAVAARELGLALHDVSSGEIAAPVPEGGPWGPILVLGSILFAHQWAREDPLLAPWIFWDDAAYDAATWADQMGSAYLNAEGYSTTVGDFVSSASRPRHIRPRSGIKMVADRTPTESTAGRRSIAGCVVSPSDLAALNVDPATPIWATAPKRIIAEIRVWMIDGRPAAASTYRIDDQHVRSASHPLVAEAIETARHHHERWRPGRHYVVDLGLVGEGWRIVEYNPIHSSGWYHADPRLVISAYMDAMSEHPGRSPQ